MGPSARLMGRADRARVGGVLETFWTPPNRYNCKFGDSVFRAVSVAIRMVVGTPVSGHVLVVRFRCFPRRFRPHGGMVF